MAQLKNLPLGISSIDMIVEHNALYIDKTEIIKNLITAGRRYFLTRPRRFGKSLLISVLKEILQGNRELFKQHWIGKDSDYSWEKHHVIHLDMSKLNLANAATLKQSLEWMLEQKASDAGLDITGAPSSHEKIDALTKGLAKQGKIALLIDEYDAPLLRHISDTATAKEIRDVLAGFYTTIKGLDARLHFTLFTGVSKFSKTSVFSGSNNLTDISLDPRYATLCGYTEEEIKRDLAPYIEAFARNKNRTEADILEEMRHWYNGYRFSYDAVAKVYNPYSVLHYLYMQRCDNYWFATGTPRFLIDLIKKNVYNFTTIDHSLADSTMLGTFEVEQLPLVTLLYQTGYLTIEEYDEATHLYKLTYPNEEVRRSLNDHLITNTLSLQNAEVRIASEHMKTALSKEDIEGFCTTLQSLFAHIPHQIHIAKEAYYHSLLQMICMILGFDVTSEVSTSNGRIDMLIETKKACYLFELKLEATAEKAIAQIKERRYYEKYLASGKRVFIVGLAFSFKTKKLTFAAEKRA